MVSPKRIRYLAVMQSSKVPLRATHSGEPGRNDPCPCGSGRKYKRCCAGKAVAVAALPGPEPEPLGRELERVRSLRDAGRFLEATRHAQRYIERRPQDPAGHAELGLVHLHAGQPVEAAPSLARAVRLTPKDPYLHYHLGLALEMLGRDAEAITAFRTVLTLDPRHVEALER